MRKTTQEKANLIEIVTLNAYWVGLSFLWNSLHVILLPVILLLHVPDDRKNTYLGLLTFAGLLIAMVLQPVSGSLSDRWRSRWGRRRPLILFGTLFDLVFLLVLAYAGGLLWLAIGYFGLQVSSNIAHGPLQGLLPDRVSRQHLGIASSLKNLFDMAGLTVASLFMGRYVESNAETPQAGIFIILFVLVVSASITLIGVKEKSTQTVQAPNFPKISPANFLQNILGDLRQNPRFAWLIAARFAFLLGVYDIQAFAQYYIRDVLAVDNPAALTGDLMAAIVLALIAFALAGGWVGDRIGHQRIQYVASLIAAAGCFAMIWARTPATLLAFGGLVGAGTGLFLTANWAMANQLAPTDQSGKFLGLTNLATAGAGALGRLAGPLIDSGNNAVPGEYLGYIFLFLLGSVSVLLSMGMLRKATNQKLDPVFSPG